MSDMTRSVFSATAGFLRGVGNQAAISVAASAIAAALLALPAGVSLWRSAGAPESAEIGAGVENGWALPVAADGKIRARHQDAPGIQPGLPAHDGQGLFSPAAIVMPMALDWAAAATDIAVVSPSRPVAASEPRARSQQAQSLPPRRPVIERAVVTAEAAPLPISPAVQVQAASLDGAVSPSRLRLLGVPMPAPVARVGDAMSGAVGFVGAAGIWTLSRASALLPRL
ncbi:hypothetical protein IP69_02745 [Bosea sp. AAP35]|uniref:hypothetical protein n=1 Tax=Bosea sp. AAP35 TaxID=1523417 RepID=UPI0006B8B579|nr:hypothetical protein [Bosea sp. AAP35]KPF72795.1 hypothetical protein IP69_02745 [Bosea sp. AAP35]